MPYKFRYAHLSGFSDISLDVEYVKELLEEYDVSYIFVGSKEREKYGDALNEEVLNSLGEVVFQDEVYSTYILKVNK